MGTELKSSQCRNGELLIKRFYGGAKDGVCFQITDAETGNFIQLTETQAFTLGLALVSCAIGQRPERVDNAA